MSEEHEPPLEYQSGFGNASVAKLLPKPDW